MSRNPVIRFPSSGGPKPQAEPPVVHHTIPHDDPTRGGLGPVERRKVKPETLGAFEQD